jgi:hypothetical protein
MGFIREFLSTPTGRWVGGTVLVLAFVALGVSWHLVWADDMPTGNDPWFICTQTGKPFQAAVDESTVIPIRSPHSGSNTGVPAESCFWNADGSVRSSPTWVLLNRYIGKPGPTFCPDCGRLVEERNPPPGPVAPPTKAEYAAQNPSKQ